MKYEDVGTLNKVGQDIKILLFETGRMRGGLLSQYRKQHS
jgi:hypothetical protein